MASNLFVEHPELREMIETLQEKVINLESRVAELETNEYYPEDEEYPNPERNEEKEETDDN